MTPPPVYMPAQGRRPTILVNLSQDLFRADGNVGRLNFDRYTTVIPLLHIRHPAVDQFPQSVLLCPNLAS
jgi:hypothetical protein